MICLRKYDENKGEMMKDISRREAIVKMAGASAGIAVLLGESSSANADASLQGAETSTTDTLTARAFRSQHQPRPLSFDPAKLKGLSESLIRSHWENNYGGAVKALNAVEQRLAAMLKEKDLPAYIYGDLKREELVRSGSVVLHELYFANLGGDPKPAVKSSTSSQSGSAVTSSGKSSLRRQQTRSAVG